MSRIDIPVFPRMTVADGEAKLRFEIAGKWKSSSATPRVMTALVAPDQYHSFVPRRVLLEYGLDPQPVPDSEILPWSTPTWFGVPTTLHVVRFMVRGIRRKDRSFALRRFRVLASIPVQEPPQYPTEAVLGLNFLVENGFHLNVDFNTFNIAVLENSWRVQSSRVCGSLRPCRRPPWSPPRKQGE